MRPILGFLVCSALAASIVEVQTSSCSLEQIRKIVKDSCTKTYRERRHILRPIPYSKEVNNEIYQAHKFLLPRRYYVTEDGLPLIPQSWLPENTTLTAKWYNEPSTHMPPASHRLGKRDAEQTYNFYFEHCCNNRKFCENLDC